MKNLSEIKEDYLFIIGNDNVSNGNKTPRTKRVMKELPINPDERITNCLKCQHTCHYPYYLSPNASKKGCDAMCNDYCTKCPGHCHFGVHENMPFRFELVEEEVYESLDDLRVKHKELLMKHGSGDSLQDALEKEWRSLYNKYKGVND